MPRPGPKPYECIRRAWHSESHQPLRGSLIQEIFRVVNDLHNSSTRRKKQWQEKVPIVVLRAEEILYSKANSESEYMDVKTLRNRLEDAVNTMIRREENDEDGSGPYLEPCVEAALSLGCLPSKASRGQRQGVPRFCANGGRRTNFTWFGPVASAPLGTKLSNSSCNSDLPFSSSCGLTQQTGTTMVNATVPRVLPRQEIGQGSAFCGSSSPVFAEADTQSFSVCYTTDGRFTPAKGGDFVRVDELSLPMTDPSYLNPHLPEFLKAFETRRQGSFPCAQNIKSILDMLPDGSSEGMLFERVASANVKMDSGLTGMNLFCSPSTINPLLLLSSPSFPQFSAFNFEESADADRHLDTPRCKVSEDQTQFLVDSNFNIQMSQSGSDEMCCNDTSSQIAEAQSLRSCKPSPYGYDETACSSSRVPSKEMASSVSAPAEKDSASSVIEVHDLQLRLGPPGTEQKRSLSVEERVTKCIGDDSYCSSSCDGMPQMGMEFPAMLLGWHRS